jgi:Ca2+-binding EF-hand superfamily protein
MLKKQIYMEMNKSLVTAKKSLKGLFSRVDIDQSDKIDVKEFEAMFKKMGLNLTNDQCKNIFQSIDFDLSGDISFPEFIADFEHTV